MQKGSKLKFTTDVDSAYARLVRSITFLILNVHEDGTTYDLGRLDNKGKNPTGRTDELSKVDGKWQIKCVALCGNNNTPIEVKYYEVKKKVSSGWFGKYSKLKY